MEKETENKQLENSEEVLANDGFTGTIVSIFTKKCGGKRMVVENLAGRMEIYAPGQLHRISNN